PVDGGRREHQRDVRVDAGPAGRREVLDEGPLLDRAGGDRVLLVGARDGLEDVVDAVVGRVHAGQERRPSGPGVGWDGRAQHRPLPLGDQALEVGQISPLEQGVQDAPVSATPSDQKYAGHRLLQVWEARVVYLPAAIPTTD